ncbi:replication initiation protein [Halomonas sp. QHL1]|uniref:replication initiation protein n=2 Tax=Halomonas sp. QHL1 TaxID=1123773 RepID=UPI0009F97063|nr:replication initiation protein [Halomonas sp. QHL1]
MSQPQIYKSNALVEAQYRLSVAEQRIMLACISQVRRDQPITDDVLYSVSAAEIAAISDTSTKQAYRELEKAALRLKRREVRLVAEPNGQGHKRKIMLTGWVQTIIYVEEEGRVELRFTKDMLPYLTQLTEQFTRYALADIAQMTSSHAIRLYELLCQWRDTGRREVEIGWLREALQLDDKYPVLKDFKRRVIEPAIEQINEHSPLWVKWDQRKTGRRVSHLIFTFGEKTDEKKGRKKRQEEQKTLGPPGERRSVYGIPPEVIAKHARPGDEWEDAALRALETRKSRQH